MTGMKLIETKSIFFVRKYSGECKIDRNDVHDEAFYIFFVDKYSGESKNDRNEIENLIEATFFLSIFITAIISNDYPGNLHKALNNTCEMQIIRETLLW